MPFGFPAEGRRSGGASPFITHRGLEVAVPLATNCGWYRHQGICFVYSTCTNFLVFFFLSFSCFLSYPAVRVCLSLSNYGCIEVICVSVKCIRDIVNKGHIFTNSDSLGLSFGIICHIIILIT